MSTGDGWEDVLFAGMDAVGVGEAPERSDFNGSALYFLAWIFVGNFIALNLFIGAIVDNFIRIKAQHMHPRTRTRMHAHAHACTQMQTRARTAHADTCMHMHTHDPARLTGAHTRAHVHAHACTPAHTHPRNAHHRTLPPRVLSSGGDGRQCDDDGRPAAVGQHHEVDGLADGREERTQASGPRKPRHNK